MRKYLVSWDMVRSWVKSEGTKLRRSHKHRLHEFTQAIRDIDENLQLHPLSFGEPHYDYKHLGLTVCIAFSGPLVVHYGVNKRTRTAFVSQLGWRNVNWLQ